MPFPDTCAAGATSQWLCCRGRRVHAARRGVECHTCVTHHGGAHSRKQEFCRGDVLPVESGVEAAVSDSLSRLSWRLRDDAPSIQES